MFRIAIIEDHDICRDILLEEIQQWGSITKAELEIVTFESGEAFLAHTKEFHVIFMDIELGEARNGIEIAKRFRRKGRKGEIIFTTSHQEYVLEGYEVHAYQYFLKPLNPKKLRHVLDDLYQKYSRNYFTVSLKGSTLRIAYQDILYVASSNHNVDIYVAGKKTPYSPKQKFSDIVKTFPENFRQSHRTILVNMDYVSHISKMELHLTDGSILPISTTYLRQIQQAMLQLSGKAYCSNVSIRRA